MGFSKHASKRISERHIFDYTNYGGAGDAFLYLDKHCRFEPTFTVKDEHKVPAITFYGLCLPGHFCYQFVTNVLEDYDPTKAYYYRIGYCPVGLNGDFASAITFLSPGMKGTQEYKLLEEANLTRQERRALLESIRNSGTLNDLDRTNDYRAIKWFHNNGIPQIFESDGFKYKPYWLESLFEFFGLPD
ncbi:MAG: hypothetical protein HQK59_07955 [Deltaproteobacteria bacterium]|nr:hypothetical protein [Deltaproteobacteria bacterium]